MQRYNSFVHRDVRWGWRGDGVCKCVYVGESSSEQRHQELSTGVQADKLICIATKAHSKPPQCTCMEKFSATSLFKIHCMTMKYRQSSMIEYTPI